MHRRVVAAIVAILLASVGAVLLLGYVANADQRALAGMDPVTVLVVAAPIAEGTPADELDELVTSEALPASAVAPGAMTSLSQVTGQVAVTDLEPGEQVLSQRFTEPEAFIPTSEVEVPLGMHEITIGLDSVRVLGGHLAAGETVGVFVSFEYEEGANPEQTHLVLHKVLVTRVQGGVAAPEPAPAASSPDSLEAPAATEPQPAGYVMVTLALTAPDAETMIFANEFGSVWLSLENADASEEGARIVTKEVVY